MPPFGCNCCEGVTMRLFDIGDVANDGLIEEANGDTGAFIQPNGNTVLHGTSIDGAGLLVAGGGRIVRYWVTGTRTDGVTSWLHDSTGALQSQTLDHGADTYAMDWRSSGVEEFIVVTGGEANANGHTLRAWDVNTAGQPYTNAWNNSALTKVNAMRIPVFVSDKVFAVGAGNAASVAAVGALNGGVTEWTVDPTGGAGEAVSIWSPNTTYGAVVLFRDTNPNVWLIEIDNVIDNVVNPGSRVVDSISLMSGALAVGDGVVGGERTNGHTIEAFPVSPAGHTALEPFGNKQVIWTYDTGSTVRGIYSFGNFHAAVGDANANGETMWILDTDGNLITTFKHGASLRAINSGADEQLVVCGDRVVL